MFSNLELKNVMTLHTGLTWITWIMGTPVRITKKVVCVEMARYYRHTKVGVNGIIRKKTVVLAEKQVNEIQLILSTSL